MGLHTRRRGVRILLGCGLLMALAAGSSGWLLYSGTVWFNNPDPAVYPVQGVDVSHYQGEIDWTQLSQQDVSFAYIKATEGSSFTDERFAENWTAAQQAGIFTGAYHFFSFDSAGDTQADNFISVVPRVENTLPPVIDLEFYGDKADNPPPVSEVSEKLDALIGRLTAYYGVAPVIYTTEACRKRYLKGAYGNCPLWIRSVFAEPEAENWCFWQYNSRGRLEGYDGEEQLIDLNVYHGSRAEFLKQFSLTE